MKTAFFRLVTGIAAVYHILLAAAGLLCPAGPLEKLIAVAFGVAVKTDAVMVVVLKFVSAYMLVFGVLLLLLARDPGRYRALAAPALILFGVRFVNRLVFFGTLTAAGMTVSRNVIGTGLILFFFAAILLSLPKAGDPGHAHVSSADA
jgi:hypothetical protein